MNRRHFLVSASAAASQAWAGANDRVRVAIVGVGSRGSAHIKEILPVGNVEVAALVDVDGRRTEQASSIVFDKNFHSLPPRRNSNPLFCQVLLTL